MAGKNAVQKILARDFGEQLLFRTTIHRAVKHREATVYGQTIFERAPGEHASEQFLALTREVVERLSRSDERQYGYEAGVGEVKRG